MNIYIIWNKEESRPVITIGSMGEMIVFPAEANAEAFLSLKRAKGDILGDSLIYGVKKFTINA